MGPSTFPLSGYGLVGASDDPSNITATNSLSAGVAVWHRIYVPANTAINGAATYVNSAGSTVGAGIQGFSVYEESGTLVASVSSNTIFTSTGWRSAAFSSPVAAQGSGRFVYVGFVCNLTSAPTTAGAGTGAPAFNGGVSVTNRRCFYASGVTSWPSSITVASHGTISNQTNLVGIY